MSRVLVLSHISPMLDNHLDFPTRSPIATATAATNRGASQIATDAYKNVKDKIRARAKVYAHNYF